MTNIQKALITLIATTTFAAFAQSTTGTPMMGIGSTTGTSSMGSGTSSTTSGAMASDPARVRQVQQALMDKGISNGGVVDGFWGARSTAALREFQRQQNLPVTGQIDSATTSALGLSGSGFSPGTPSNDTASGMQQRQGRNPSDVIDDTAPMDNTTPGTGRSPSDTQQR